MKKLIVFFSMLLLLCGCNRVDVMDYDYLINNVITKEKKLNNYFDRYTSCYSLSDFSLGLI